MKRIMAALAILGVATVAHSQSQGATPLQDLDRATLKQHGLVLAFTVDCPPGWQPLDLSEGRVLIGVFDDYKPGARGGDEKHAHPGTTLSTGHSTLKVKKGRDYRMSPETHWHVLEIAEEEDLPPFVAVKFCQLQ